MGLASGQFLTSISNGMSCPLHPTAETTPTVGFLRTRAMDEIKDCCYQSNERDVHDALERKFEGTSMETCDDYDLWSCIQKDFTTNAKKIVQVFMEYIRPVCKKISDDEKRG